MKTKLPVLLTAFILALGWNSQATVHYVALTSTNPTPPFLDWTTAAATIQDAIDASVDGDQVLVAGGVYQTGGKVMYGDLVNRVVLDKAVAVQSVNGPWVTVIRGAGMVNGTAAVRCAWLTNGAVLSGFTLTGGATRNLGDTTNLQSGGAAWCASASATVANCLIVSNTAWGLGSGVFQGTIQGSLLSGNSHYSVGCAAYAANLANCTVVSNGLSGVSPPIAYSRATNCILYYNPTAPAASVLSYCCLTFLLAGEGNFSAAPQFFADGVHLAAGSPCIGAGTNVVSGTDVFGLAWANPPAVGCAEWNPAPVVTVPQLGLTNDPVGFRVGAAALDGQAPFAFQWLKDGTPLQNDGHFSGTRTANLAATGVGYSDAGSFQLVVSNAWGVSTSGVAQLVVHCVDAAGVNPIAPYSSWQTAATNIQDAISVAAANEVVLVTNGLYAHGSVSVDGASANRVAVTKTLLVQSINGPSVTVIQGAWDPITTNGPGAVRCVWLTTNAILSGFTLSGGATASTAQGSGGGGVVGVSTNWPYPTATYPNATVANCILTNNRAAGGGGGAYLVLLLNCTLVGNASGGTGGGGAYTCALRNCLITQNSSPGGGGGIGGAYTLAQNCALTQNSCLQQGSAAMNCTLLNCTLSGNIAAGTTQLGGAAYNCNLTSCVVWGNLQRTAYPDTNYDTCTMAFCCTTPQPPGQGNIGADPQLLPDGIHLAATSPCRRAGVTGLVAASDIDGQPWNRPPSIGCDEWQPVPVLAGAPSFQVTAPGCLDFSVPVAGQAPFTGVWTKDGVPVANNLHYTNSGTPNLEVMHLEPGDAGVYQAVLSNSFGVVTSQVVQVVVRAVDAAGSNPVVPFTTWASAATTIQDAINVAAAGDIVLVTNGLYASGGKVMAGDLTNRVALDKALTVTSVNGYSATVIQGAWDPASTNGPGAVRCAWLTNGAALLGFTLRNGATRAPDGRLGSPATSGGGVWCSYTNALVFNCVLSNNSAVYGGGISFGTLNNSLVLGNSAPGHGGGGYGALLNNCTVVNNLGGAYYNSGAGTYNCVVRNSIVMSNCDAPSYDSRLDNYAYDSSYFPTKYVYSYTYPGISGTGNLGYAGASPQLLDAFHIASTSPCYGTGSALYATGTDLDGEAWASPPSMGCDEVVLANLVGPLSVNLVASQTNLLVSPMGLLSKHWASFWGTIFGRASRVEWNYGDGPTISSLGATTTKAWTNIGDYTVSFTAFNTDNPGGVSTSVLVHVTNPFPPQLQGGTLVSNNFGFQFAGEQDAHYFVQYATNLTSPVLWQSLQAFYYSTGQVYQISDPAGTNSVRFYRVLAQ